MTARIRPFGNKVPQLDPSVFVAEGAFVIGEVWLGPEVNIWYGAVLRGDVGFIRVGARSNIQDLVCVHMTTDLSNTEIGEDVTIGHGAILHGARIGNGALIGMGSVLLDNCEIGSEALIAAGSLVAPGIKIPPRVLVRGQPGRVVRELTESEWVQGRLGAERYLKLARQHAVQG